MTTLPTSPFPELRPLEESRQVPSLADLLSSKTGLPIQTAIPEAPSQPSQAPTPSASEPVVSGRPPLRVSRLPTASPSQAPKPGPSGILDEMPVATPGSKSTGGPPSPASIADYMAAPSPESGRPAPAAAPKSTTAEGSEPAKPASLTPAPVPDPTLKPQSRRRSAPTQPLPVPQEDGLPPAATDDDLKDALLPIFEATLNKALSAPGSGLYTHLEPMLRSTVRRAIAEQMQSSGQFRNIGAADRLAWRLNALLTSRSYDEIVFERTRRYQVEELFLLRKSSHTLISYASHDPVRHASLRRVEPTVERLVSRLLDSDGELQHSFELPERRVALVRSGRHALLVTVLRGSSNALVRADLDYVLRQAEDRYDDLLEEETDIFVHALQPILEGGLLIQSPAPPH